MSFDLHSMLTLMTSTLPSSSSPSLSGSCSIVIQPRTCADPRGLGGDRFTESEPRTGYKPTRVVDSINPIVTEQESVQSAVESQIPEIEDKFSLPCNQSLLSSTQDSFESLATPQEADLDDEQIRALLASPQCLREREAIAERSQIHHSERECLLSRSLNVIGTRKPMAWLSHQKRLGQDEFSERGQPDDVLRGNESVLRDAHPANVAKSLLERNRDRLLTQARSELMKQEHKGGISQ